MDTIVYALMCYIYTDIVYFDNFDIIVPDL